ncbi:hypothetical protein [Bythopirellula goksoeyrii]|uniref:Uncharacterized protein n=1 Tax=Bythopirellula goksoeyrii TaxID=1400387 RepID=A0A5B9QA22_9BACT|nr:hypothetical protein [Bythopirellula goksoeyrii]QEG34599.1 hypothetical protein Pr1d_18800 [Bythopirellula goksoeyrii]
METLIPIIVQILGGGVGGNIVGALLKNVNLTKLVQTVVGIVGGVLGGQAADWMGILESVLNSGGAGAILGNAGTSGIGGAVLVAIVGLIKKAMAGSAS